MEDYKIVVRPRIQCPMEREGFEDNAALINEKKNKEEIMNKEFRVSEHFTISRGDYESFPCPMFAWKWTDEQMEELAKSIGQKLCRYDENDPDGMEDDFWITMEDEAVAMGMQYYDDLTKAEFESQNREWNNIK